MDFVYVPLFSAAALVFASVLAGLFSARSGFSFLLVFLFAGILAAEDGLGGYRLNDYKLSFWVGNLALAVMLLEGGLRTTFATFRTGLRPASVLATVPHRGDGAVTGEDPGFDRGGRRGGEAQRDFLVRLGCRGFLGYLFGRPGPVSQRSRDSAP
jgi:hypothetical protein